MPVCTLCFRHGRNLMAGTLLEIEAGHYAFRRKAAAMWTVEGEPLIVTPRPRWRCKKRLSLVP